jgi:hypothetical protein
MVWTTSEGDLSHPKCAYTQTEKWFSEIGSNEEKTKSDLEKLEEEQENITIICSVEEVKNFEAFDWHVLDDSDLMAGGEVDYGK